MAFRGYVIVHADVVCDGCLCPYDGSNLAMQLTYKSMGYLIMFTLVLLLLLLEDLLLQLLLLPPPHPPLLSRHTIR